jgi:carboxypeptidase D
VPGLGPDGDILQECDIYEDIYRASVTLNPCFDIYNVDQVCPTPEDVLTANSPWNQGYFNRSDVKRVIHAPLESTWQLCTDTPVIADFIDQSPPSALTNGPLQRVIEATNNVIVAHGTLDMILLLNGTLLTLQNLTWNGAQGFTAPPVHPFHVPLDMETTLPAGAGELGQWTSDRGLTFCTVELSGHEIPAYQPAAALRQLELLLGRIANLSEVSSFTTRQSPSWSTRQLVDADCA